MPVDRILKPGQKVEPRPGNVITPGSLEDDPSPPEDERQPKIQPDFTNLPDFDFDGKPDEYDTDDDNDGTPDTSDPELQNPNVSVASENPPQPAPSEGEQAVDQVREDYNDFLDKPENTGYVDRLNAIEEKYKRAAAMEEEAAVDPDVGFEQDRLIGEADTEFRQLENEIGEAWWSSLSQYQQQLFDGRPQSDINEMQMRMKQWDKSTYDDVAHSILDHSSRKGYEDPLEFLRDVSNFDKSQAERIPEVGVGDKGTVRWEIRRTGEHRIETPDGQFVTYGFNPY